MQLRSVFFFINFDCCVYPITTLFVGCNKDLEQLFFCKKRTEQEVCHSLLHVCSITGVSYGGILMTNVESTIIVARKHINIVRERKSLRSHTEFLCSRTKPDACAQIHAALAKCGKRASPYSRVLFL